VRCFGGQRPAGTPTNLEARLGKLLQLPKRGRSAKPASEPQEPAKIVLFTGVRYERDGAPQLPTKPAGAASGKRRRG
jgi:hypothetical protein